MTKTILGAIALALAVPAAAQTTPAPAPDAEHESCCEKMKAEGKECCCKKMNHEKHGEKKPTSADHQDHAAH